MRDKTVKVWAGNVPIGGDADITVQSMTNTNTSDVNSTIRQIKELESVGCDIVRVAVPDIEAARAIKEIKKNIDIPLVADIHFDYKLALESIKHGIDKIRINPGNIGDKNKIKEVVRAAKEREIPIRIGVNSGSIEKELLVKYGKPCPEAMVESAINHIQILEELYYNKIVVSLKASDVMMTVNAYNLMSQSRDYPLHIGITEAGTLHSGTIKSSVGIGAILSLGIGNTIRVSLTGNPIEEIKVGKGILKALGLRKNGIEFISCPTCGRTKIDLITIANEVETALQGVDKNIKVAIMGCVVNGPGEAREADIGIAGGEGCAVLFKKGEVVRKIAEQDIFKELIAEIETL